MLITGKCADIEVPDSLTVELKRVGSGESISVTTTPKQADGTIICSISKADFQKAKKGRYVASVKGIQGCNICVPIMLGGYCTLADLSVLVSGDDESCGYTAPETAVLQNTVPFIKR